MAMKKGGSWLIPIFCCLFCALVYGLLGWQFGRERGYGEGLRRCSDMIDEVRSKP